MKVLLSLVLSYLFTSTTLVGGVTSSGGGVRHVDTVPTVSGEADAVPTISGAWFPVGLKAITFCIEKNDEAFPLPDATYADRFRNAFKFWQRELAFGHGSPQEEDSESLLQLRRDLAQELQEREADRKEAKEQGEEDYSWEAYVIGLSRSIERRIRMIELRILRILLGAPLWAPLWEPLYMMPDNTIRTEREKRAYELRERDIARAPRIETLQLKIEKLEEVGGTSPFEQPLVYMGLCSNLPRGSDEETPIDLAFMLGRLTAPQIKVLNEPKSYYAAAYKLPEGSSANTKGFVYLAGPGQSISPDAFDKDVWEQIIHSQEYNIRLFNLALLHEIGHIYGLNHCTSDMSLMSPYFVHYSIKNALNDPHLVPGVNNMMMYIGVIMDIEDVLPSNLGVFRFPASKTFKILNPEDFGLPPLKKNQVYQLTLKNKKHGIIARISVYNRPSFGFGSIKTYHELNSFERETIPLSVLTKITRVDSQNPTTMNTIQLMSTEIVASTDWNGGRLVLNLKPNGEISATLSQDGKSIAMILAADSL
ncbi:MAG: matrixin family metalloprotease [Oligoflexales bacterium]|nr:matrixin family metalloprotease [Oligoflexales bacterium]